MTGASLGGYWGSLGCYWGELVGIDPPGTLPGAWGAQQVPAALGALDGTGCYWGSLCGTVRLLGVTGGVTGALLV